MSRAFIFFIFIISIGCSSGVIKVFSGGDLKNIKPNELIQASKETNPEFIWYSAKASCEVNQNGSKNSFSVNIKWKKDSAIWISVSPALGIEVFRVLLRKDSIFVLNKIDKEFYYGDYEGLGEKMNTEITFDGMQKIFTGSLAFIGEDEKFKVFKGENEYVLKNVPSRKLIRGFGLRVKKEKEEIPLDSLLLYSEENRKIEKALNKAEDEVFIKRYYLNPDYSLKHIFMHDVRNNRVLESHFSDYVKVQEQIFPSNVQVEVYSQKEKTSFELNIAKQKLNIPQRLSFKVTSKYVAKKL